MRTLIWVAALGVIIAVVIRQPFGPLATHQTKLKTSDFIRRIQQGTIKTIVLERIKASGTMEPQDPREYRDFYVELPLPTSFTARSWRC